MKTILLSVLFLCASVSFAQKSVSVPKPDTFIPLTLYAGTAMSARTAATTYDDTTRGFITRNYSSVYVGIETATNDSARILIAYQPSTDGVTYDAAVLFDSLSTTGTVGKIKYFALPASALGAYSCRVRVYGNAEVAGYSANPSTTVTTRIIRKQQ